MSLNVTQRCHSKMSPKGKCYDAERRKSLGDYCIKLANEFSTQRVEKWNALRSVFTFSELVPHCVAGWGGLDLALKWGL